MCRVRWFPQRTEPLLFLPIHGMPQRQQYAFETTKASAGHNLADIQTGYPDSVSSEVRETSLEEPQEDLRSPMLFPYNS